MNLHGRKDIVEVVAVSICFIRVYRLVQSVNRLEVYIKHNKTNSSMHAAFFGILGDGFVFHAASIQVHDFWFCKPFQTTFPSTELFIVLPPRTPDSILAISISPYLSLSLGDCIQF